MRGVKKIQASVEAERRSGPLCRSWASPVLPRVWLALEKQAQQFLWQHRQQLWWRQLQRLWPWLLLWPFPRPDEHPLLKLPSDEFRDSTRLISPVAHGQEEVRQNDRQWPIRIAYPS